MAERPNRCAVDKEQGVGFESANLRAIAARAGVSAGTLVLGADRDLSFPGEKVLARAAELFPSLTDKELIRDCNHCPPTTDEFRGWVSNRISQFLLAN